MIFLNTHFDYQSTAIAESARLLRQWVDQAVRDRPLIVTGDFNTDKDSTAYRQLTGNGTLFDAYRRVHPGGEDEATFHGFGGQSELTPIDWILASDQFRVVDARVDQSQEGNLFPSDHYPVTAVLDWNDGHGNMTQRAT